MKLKHFFKTLVLTGLTTGAVLFSGCRSAVASLQEKYDADFITAMDTYNKDVAAGKKLEGVFLIDNVHQEIMNVSTFNGGEAFSSLNVGVTELKNIKDQDTLDVIAFSTDMLSSSRRVFAAQHQAEAALKSGENSFVMKNAYIQVLSKEQLAQLKAEGWNIQEGKTYGFSDVKPQKSTAKDEAFSKNQLLANILQQKPNN